ncbi:hypothetical protein FJZ23_01510 [Candidatus Parcubacteria bacterium]|nr:hypothetical protein [Candidatus Parcubacteria bacterium]
MLTRVLQLLIILIPLGVFVWLLRIELVPDGTFEIAYHIGKASPYLDELVPQNRLRDGRFIVDDPVYTFMHPHRRFDRVLVAVRFKNTSAPILEFGPLMQTKPDVYDLRPLHNHLIDQLGWPVVHEGELSLYQRTPVYDSLRAFRTNPPSRARVAVYKADEAIPLRLPTYVASSQARTMEATLRGKHDFKTYIKNETLFLALEYMDMNRDEGADALALTVFNEDGEPVADVRAEDDGQTRDDAIPSSMQTLTLSVPGLPEGVYKIALNAPRDIFVRKLRTKQSKFVLVGSLYLGDEIAYRETPRALDVWTASPRLRVQTRHAQGVQDLTSADRTFAIAAPYEMYTFDRPGTLAPVHVPKGDLEIVFDGALAFSQEAYFEPDAIPIRSYTNMDAQGIDFILTSYRPPERVDGWLVQRLTFDAAPLVFDKGAWKFTFSAPDIRARGGEVEVDGMEVVWERESFHWSDLLDGLKRAD